MTMHCNRPLLLHNCVYAPFRLTLLTMKTKQKNKKTHLHNPHNIQHYIFSNLNEKLSTCLVFLVFGIREWVYRLKYRKVIQVSDSNEIWTHNRLICKRILKHLLKLAKWLSCVVSSYLYGAFDCMLLSCHVWVFQRKSTLYSLSECQGTPCSKQTPYLKFKWQQRDSNSQPISSSVRLLSSLTFRQTIECGFTLKVVRDMIITYSRPSF